MRSPFGNSEVVAREIRGHFVPSRDIVVPPSKFGDVCRVLWPDKTAFHLAALSGKDERTAKRWLSTEYDPPISVLLAVIHKMFDRS